MTGTLLNMGLVVGTLIGLIAGLALWRRMARPHPEVTRKVVHVGMGLVSLALPSQFDDTWPVVALAAVCTCGLLLLRLERFRDNLGAVLGGVGRSWFGEVCFVAGVATLFVLYGSEDGHRGRRPVLFVAPLLVLAIADAAAALVGVRYGRWRYRTAGDWKTAEGSAAFLACAFVCTLVPLLLLTELTSVRALLAAALLAWVAMLLEGIGTHGTDNFLLPVGCFMLLRGMLDLNAAHLTSSLALILALTGLLLLSPARPRRVVIRGPRPVSARNDTRSRISPRS